MIRTMTLSGFDIDMTKAIGEKLGLKVEFQPIAWEGIFEALKTDRYDVIISSVSMTPERLQNFEFTKPYLANGQVIVAKPGDTKIKSAKDLAGFKVGVQTNTTADTACVKYIDTEKIKFELTRYDDIIQTFEAMNARSYRLYRRRLRCCHRLSDQTSGQVLHHRRPADERTHRRLPQKRQHRAARRDPEGDRRPQQGRQAKRVLQDLVPGRLHPEHRREAVLSVSGIQARGC